MNIPLRVWMGHRFAISYLFFFCFFFFSGIFFPRWSFPRSLLRGGRFIVFFLFFLSFRRLIDVLPVMEVLFYVSHSAHYRSLSLNHSFCPSSSRWQLPPAIDRSSFLAPRFFLPWIVSLCFFFFFSFQKSVSTQSYLNSSLSRRSSSHLLLLLSSYPSFLLHLSPRLSSILSFPFVPMEKYRLSGGEFWSGLNSAFDVVWQLMRGSFDSRWRLHKSKAGMMEGYYTLKGEKNCNK